MKTYNEREIKLTQTDKSDSSFQSSFEPNGNTRSAQELRIIRLERDLEVGHVGAGKLGWKCIRKDGWRVDGKSGGVSRSLIDDSIRFYSINPLPLFNGWTLNGSDIKADTRKSDTHTKSDNTDTQKLAEQTGVQ